MRRPRPKVCFRRFSFVGRGRNTVFVIFMLSATAESLFSLFFTRRPWPKAIFHRFLGFGRGRRNAIHQSRGLLGGPETETVVARSAAHAYSRIGEIQLVGTAIYIWIRRT